MPVDISHIKNVKTVNKPWGYEKWLADGNPDFKYALKEILFRAPYSSSIQFHEYKEETNYVQKGKGNLFYSTKPINFKKFHAGEYSKEDFKIIINGLKKQELSPGVVFHIKPGYVHRVEATTDLVLIESSTIELDDVYRLNDQWGRADGKIDDEHLEFVKIDNIYKEYVNRYMFASKFLYGKILDHTYGSFTAYTDSKILLEKDVKEVWSKDAINSHTNIVKRKFGNDGSIELENMNIKNIEELQQSFNGLISSEILQHQKNPEQVLNKYYDLLENEGILIISTTNSDATSLLTNKKNSQLMKGYSSEEFLNLLKNKFQSVELFSQRLITKRQQFGKFLEPLTSTRKKLRKSLSKVILKVDKNSNFYKLHIQNTVLTMNEIAAKIDDKWYNKIYEPIPFKVDHTPLFFVAVCKKK